MDSNKLNLSIEQIIMRGNYYCLSWQDRANGTDLTANFNTTLFAGRRMLIKSIKLVPYAHSETDVLYNDTTGDHYTIPALARLHNVLDAATLSPRINIRINGGQLTIFPSQISGSYPLDLFLDNIFYIVNQQITSMNVAITGESFIDLAAGTTEAPDIKVLIECYLF